MLRWSSALPAPNYSKCWERDRWCNKWRNCCHVQNKHTLQKWEKSLFWSDLDCKNMLSFLKLHKSWPQLVSEKQSEWKHYYFNNVRFVSMLNRLWSLYKSCSSAWRTGTGNYYPTDLYPFLILLSTMTLQDLFNVHEASDICYNYWC